MTDLDDLLADFRADTPEMTEHAFTRGRDRLAARIEPAGAPEPITEREAVVIPLGTRADRSPPRRAAPWLVAAAAVAVLAAGVFITQDQQPTTTPGAQRVSTARTADPATSTVPTPVSTYELPPQPAQPVNPAADLITTPGTDLVVPAGQFRYVRLAGTQDGLDGGPGGTATREYWVPTDLAQGQWLLEVNSTGTIQGAPEGGHSTERGTAEQFDGVLIARLNGLAADPAAVYASLRTQFGTTEAPATKAAAYLIDLLRSPWATAAQRSVLLRTLGYLDSVTVLPSQQTADGRPAVSVGWSPDADYRHDLLIDPATARVIGDRNVATRPFNGFTADQAFTTTAVTEAVVPTQGTRPGA
ncbi:hypothetical protein [Actinokineospora sp. NBRC 105648]|uniref:hypothetical protein n=1 Tax=Actinokineospora sp. NBRC 105648 TaxID=3032206 RepID=UPI0024A4EDC7|nr:hypothetical protein [Actinokineospora sp. NBRC 105648]GLZ40395.1 hypothetical protein Acsp05_40190 [Actinokineospora sp. NBRC 105648]